MMTYDEIVHAAVELSPNERCALITTLIHSLDTAASQRTSTADQLADVLQHAVPGSALHRIIGSRTPIAMPDDWRKDYTDYLIRKYMHDEHPH